MSVTAGRPRLTVQREEWKLTVLLNTQQEAGRRGGGALTEVLTNLS